MQNEAPRTHLPPEQSPEQQLPAPPSGALQGLPAVKQVVLSGWHLLPLQFPLQQAAEEVQLWLSAVQLVAVVHLPVEGSHCRLQQSVEAPHGLPAPEQVVTVDTQVWDDVSHACEQHWAFEVHETFATEQPPVVPPLPVVDVPPPPVIPPPLTPPPLTPPPLTPPPLTPPPLTPPPLVPALPGDPPPVPPVPGAA
jgi:hypothetical protein